MTAHKAILVSENRLFRDGIRQLLESSRISVIREGRELLELSAAEDDQDDPDLVIFHLASEQNPEASLGVVRRLREHFTDAKVVVLADACVKSILPSFVRADVSAILLTDISSDLLQRSLELVLCEHRLFPADVLSPVTSAIRPRSTIAAQGAIDIPTHTDAGPDGHMSADTFGSDLELSPSLSKREYQVVQCLAIGLSNKIIARELNITEGTVKVHVKGLLRKIRASNRTQLAIWALRHARMAGSDARDAA